MWRPDDVVTEHKKQATALWVALLLITVGFIAWQTAVLVEKCNDPNTSFSASDDSYRFPYTEVCMGREFGCDWNLSSCIESVNAKVLDPCDNEWDVQIESAPTSASCVTFDMGQVETEAFTPDCLGAFERPYVTVYMNWISDNQTSLEYKLSAFVFLGGAEVQQAIGVPYTRFVSPDDQLTPEVSIAQTDLTIGRNVMSFLSGDDTITYPILTSSTTYTITQDPSDWYFRISDQVLGSSANSSSSIGKSPALGDLRFTLSLGSFSLTEISEENPVDMFGFIGNIGGFWEILLLVWGLFFISKHTGTTPRQEARSLSRAIQQGIMMVNRPVVVTAPQRARVTITDEFDMDEYPNLSTDSRHASTSSIHGRISADESSV